MGTVPVVVGAGGRFRHFRLRGNILKLNSDSSHLTLQRNQCYLSETELAPCSQKVVTLCRAATGGGTVRLRPLQCRSAPVSQFSVPVEWRSEAA